MKDQKKLQKTNHLAQLALSLLAGAGLLLCSTSSTAKIRQLDGPPSLAIDPNTIPDIMPRPEPLSRRGNHRRYRVFGRWYKTLRSAKNYHARGIASWYGRKFHNRKTANGEIYDMYAMTAAHKSLPLPTYLRVTNLDNNKQVIVRVNDRGPFHDDRLIDLSYAAALKLGVVNNGTAHVELTAIDPNDMHADPLEPEQNLILQVGAFNSYENAQQVAQAVADLTQHVVNIEQGRSKASLMYYVKLGPLEKSETYDDIQAQLYDAGYADSIVLVTKT